jgi:2-alkenal reductase
MRATMRPRHVLSPAQALIRGALAVFIVAVALVTVLHWPGDNGSATAQADTTTPPTTTQVATAPPQAQGQTVAAATAQSFASVADLVQAVNPAVVTVINEQTFRGFGSANGTTQPVGSGTGFVIDADGHIVTNNHVVEGATSLQVILTDGTKVPATLVGTDAVSDLAVIKVDSASVPAVVSLGDSDALRVGDIVIAIGSPLGEYTNTVTEGIVSGIDRTLEGSGTRSLHGLIQHDAAINPGNSGGPLFNASGEVVGVNTAVIRQTGNGQTVEGLGFAIPSNTVRQIAETLMRDGKVTRPYLGITYGMLNAQVAAAQNLSIDHGAYVQDVVAGSPAATAGLRAGDVITALNGQTIDASNGLDTLLLQHQPGESVTLTVTRTGTGSAQEVTITVTLGTRPANT